MLESYHEPDFAAASQSSHGAPVRIRRRRIKTRSTSETSCSALFNSRLRAGLRGSLRSPARRPENATSLGRRLPNRERCL
jgi:hypothetical protein